MLFMNIKARLPGWIWCFTQLGKLPGPVLVSNFQVRNSFSVFCFRALCIKTVLTIHHHTRIKALVIA